MSGKSLWANGIFRQCSTSGPASICLACLNPIDIAVATFASVPSRGKACFLSHVTGPSGARKRPSPSVHCFVHTLSGARISISARSFEKIPLALSVFASAAHADTKLEATYMNHFYSCRRRDKARLQYYGEQKIGRAKKTETDLLLPRPYFSPLLRFSHSEDMHSYRISP